MTVKNWKKLVLIILEILISRIIKKQSIFYKLAVMSLVLLGFTLIPSLWDGIIDKLFDLTYEDKSYAGKDLTQIIFASALFTSLTFIFSFLSYRYSSYKETLINSVKKEEWISTSNSRIHTYTGSILQIKGIDVIVTSENTTLDLGSLSGTSVSGRVRKLAASYNSDLTLCQDNLLASIEDWKSRQPNKGPYQRGVIIESPSFQATNFGVKSIINAIAVEKTSDGQHLIDAEAIRKILKSSIEHCRARGHKSVFIPIFGLGSGGNEKNFAISTTIDPLIEILHQESYDLDVYLGVYRIKDLLLVSKSLLKSNA